MATFRETRSLRNERREQEHKKEERAKKSERSKRYRLLKAAVALAVAAGVVVSAWAGLGAARLSGLTDAWRLLGRQGSGFPLDYGFANLRRAALIGPSLALLGPTSLEVHTASGYQALAFPQPYAAPGLKANSGRMVLFDRDSGKFTLLSRTGKLWDKNLEHDIFCVDLNRDGAVAVGTKAENAASEINVWDAKQNRRFAWRCDKERPSALRLTGGSVGICMAGTRQAGVYARFLEFSFRQKQPRIDITIPDAWLLGAAQLSNGWIAVGDQAAYLIQRGAKQPQTLSYEGRALESFDIGDRHTAVLLQDWDNRWLLRVYDRQGALALEQDFTRQPLGVQCGGSNVYLRFADTMLRWQRSTGFRQSQGLPQGTQEAFVAGRSAYLLTLRSVEWMRLRWSLPDEAIFAS
ncbi:MAG: hypothetical protein LBG83_05835 [Oscillospiraceae bacterium]|jgi:hypothetical protein|nr:hypothetical protein [Oscillospiraceae bacterium]